MHKLVFAQQSRCPKRNRRLVLPDELPPVADELTAYALGKSKTYVLSPAEETLLYQRYVQLSYHWNPANDWNSKFDTVVINRLGDNGLRMVHPNE